MHSETQTLYKHRWAKIICIFFICLTIFSVIMGLIIGLVIVPNNRSKNTCEKNCQNGGHCTGTNTCTCASGWSGWTCENYICSKACQNRGNCSGPNTCTCPSGWTGTTCEKHTCQLNCLNGGWCSGPDTCTCSYGWSGTACESYVCVQGCLNGGWCSGPNTCSCTPNYHGPRCENSNGGCYYGNDSVSLVGGGTRLIHQLNIGDRVWSLDPKRAGELIEDEIVLMMHSGPNTTVLFYTFITNDGFEVSLTDAHNIPVFDPVKNEMTITQASNVTLQHQLIVHGRTTSIREIRITPRQGFYSPLTLSSYLLVNQIATNVFSDKYDVSADTVHLFLCPIRVYYRLTRFVFGPQYRPFQEIKDGLHPIAEFYKAFHRIFRVMIVPFQILSSMLPTTIVLFVIRYLVSPHLRMKKWRGCPTR